MIRCADPLAETLAVHLGQATVNTVVEWWEDKECSKCMVLFCELDTTTTATTKGAVHFVAASLLLHHRCCIIMVKLHM